MKFSIIFPTRERPSLLRSLLESIKETTANLENVEVLVAYDDDDYVTEDFIETEGPMMPWVIWVECKRSLNFSRDYYSHLARISNGRWIIICNDDAIFKTPRWDAIIEPILNQFIRKSPNVVYGWIEDDLGKARLTQFGNYSCFPLFGRDGVEKLGYVFPEDIPTWGADIWAWKTYALINRIVTLPMTISHICPHNGTREVDEVHERIRKNQIRIDMNPRRADIIALKDLLHVKER